MLQLYDVKTGVEFLPFSFLQKMKNLRNPLNWAKEELTIRVTREALKIDINFDITGTRQFWVWNRSFKYFKNEI